MTGDRVVPVSVVVPTVGRPSLLAACLRSLVACVPRASEIVVVDQSRADATGDLVARHRDAGARVLPSDTTGRGAALNEGLREAAHEVVLVTDDDCTVAASWIGSGWTAVSRAGEASIVTGRVLAAGDARAVPSTVADPWPREYRRAADCGKLYAGNMAVGRSRVLSLGGFDETILPAGEDVEFCYRWLRAGGTLRYEPQLVVWHHEWRTRCELENLYVAYARGVGVFYGKRLRRGDARVLALLLVDAYGAARGELARLVRRRPRWSDSRQGLLRGLPAGVLEGWRGG